MGVVAFGSGKGRLAASVVSTARNIVKVMGGLGNQMFQYAFGRALEERTGCETFLDLSWYATVGSKAIGGTPRTFELPIFPNVKFRESPKWLRAICSLTERTVKNTASETAVTRVPLLPIAVPEGAEDSVHMQDCWRYYLGYWQGERFFENAQNAIREDFTFRGRLTGRNMEISAAIAQSESVSIHIRRGDYVSNPRIGGVHGICPWDYYTRAMNYIEGCGISPIYFVFSDDIAWVEENIIDKNVVVVAGNKGCNSHIDMELMSQCKHNITANSTFSWWAAWLNANPNKLVITPNHWFADGRATDSLIPEPWIRL